MYTVYLRTNKSNGKQYVGQTKNFRNRENQWKSLKARYGNSDLQKDRALYGIGNFDVMILAEVETQEEAFELEQTFIKAYNTIFPNGYNVACGGKNNSGCGKGKHNGKEFEKGMTPWNKGKHTMSDEMKEHLSKMWVNGKLSKRVVQIKPDGSIIEWASNKECKRNGYTNVYLYCNGKNAHKFKGDEWFYKDEYEKMLGEQ